MNTVRILHIVGIMNMGGLENLIMNIYRKINRNKVQFDFLVTREEEGIFDKEILELGGRIYKIPHMSKVGYSKYKEILYKFFKEHNEYKVVHCHRDALCSVYLRQAKKAEIPIRIAHSHTTKLSESKNIKGIIMLVMKKYFMLFTNQNSNKQFACSREAGEWLFGRKSIHKNINIIKNGIDISKYNYNEDSNLKIRKELGISEDTFLIGHVGRFDIQKNHKFLVEVVDKLDKENLDYKVCFVGSGTLEKKIKSEVNRLGLQDKVIFLGIRNDIHELMMSFDLFIFPSLVEGLGIVLIEAQATGLNCLISDTIPKEADMEINLIKKLSINNIDLWVENIKILYDRRKKIRLDRKSNHTAIIEKGYDISSTAEYLEEIYIKSYNKNA